MEKLRIMSVFGTRPEAIKMCPLVQELAHILFIRLAELVSHNASLGGRRQKVILM